ncbi:MAG TPA: hypothetical protein PKB10_15310 [Tepidisphaeraceae bacterium]|nr:hypothetical protein [Tepidisphaeraceae bacterium]
MTITCMSNPAPADASRASPRQRQCRLSDGMPPAHEKIRRGYSIG